MARKSRDESRDEYIMVAKNILMKEGMSAVSARRIGVETGYSYTRVYSYFDDIDTLIWHVGLSINDDLSGILKGYKKSEGFVRKDLHELIRMYLTFHFDNPNVFKMYLSQEIKSPPADVIEKMTDPKINNQLRQVVSEIVDSEGTGLNPEMVANILMCSLYGLLSMYFGSIRVVSKEQVLAGADLFVEFVFSK